MNKLLRKIPHTGLLFLFLCFSIISGYGQGLEDFSNSNATSGYSDGTFEGNDGIIWTYTASRDGNNDENNSGIDLPALMLRRVSDNSKITSSSISNGIGSFNVKLYKGFTGGGNRQVELFINGVLQGVSPAFDDYDEHVWEINEIDIAGDFVLEIANITSKQIIIDDISWTGYGGDENSGPVISNVVQSPDYNNVTSNDAVSISADISDADGISSAEVHWGASSENLSNVIEMTVDSGITYSTVDPIPAQNDGTIIYYEIKATDAHTDPETSLSSVFSYTVLDPVTLDLPYFNNLRDQNDYDDLVGNGFSLEGTTLTTSAGGYLKITNGSIISPTLNFSLYENITVVFDIATFGGSGGQELSVLISDDNGAEYVSLASFTPESSSYETVVYAIDLSSLSGTGKIKFEMTAGSNSIRFRDFAIVQDFNGFVFTGGNWLPDDPNGISTAEDDFLIMNGTANLQTDSEVRNVTISQNSTFKIKKVLNVAGNIMNYGDLIFLSTANGNGELGPMAGEVSGTVTVHRYMSADRGYRIVSSAVTASTSIMENWQEGVHNVGTDYPSDNQNPNPGFGTHITGSVTGANGFDATISGIPSMFVLDPVQQDLLAVENTDDTSIEAGKGYLLLVRGDRGINPSDESAVATPTVLRSKGDLIIGNSMQTFATEHVRDMLIFGNPYQSGVDINSVLMDASNINPNQYYVYDPHLATNGAFVTVDLASGENTFQSAANQFLQPGQGAVVATLAEGSSSILFKESDKSPGNFTTTNSNQNRLSSENMLTFQLFTTDNFASEGPLHDSFGIIFQNGNDNGLTELDAVKPMNFDENFGRELNGTYLSLERRDLPQEGEILNIFSGGYKHSSYTIRIIIDGLENVEMYLDDQFAGTTTSLNETEVLYDFEVDESDPLSTASDRFVIKVENRLGIAANDISDKIRVYPNPLYGDVLFLNAPILYGQEVAISINDMLGREVYSEQRIFSEEVSTIHLTENLKSGIYILNVTSNGEQASIRIIKR